MLSSRIRSQPASSSSRSWSRSVTSTSTGSVGVGVADRLEGRHHAAGREHVVVLDHRHVAEAEPVVDPAAAAHGVLLQRAAARAASCGCRSTRALVPSSASTQREVAVATPERWRGEVQRGALGGQQAAGRAGDAQHARRRASTRAPSATPLGDLDVVAEHVREDQRGDAEPGDDAGLARGEVGDAAGVRRDGGRAGDVDAAVGQVLLERARRRASYTARGSSPAAVQLVDQLRRQRRRTA